MSTSSKRLRFIALGLALAVPALATATWAKPAPAAPKSCPDSDGDGHTLLDCGGDDCWDNDGTRWNSDVDGDGHRSIVCGEDDCDDQDPRRHPGNFEVCDAANKDEDCDPASFGVRDSDRDGHPDSRCCNWNGDAATCGDDCDDNAPAIVPGAMICSRRKPWVCSSDGLWVPENCTSGGTVCHPQPNQTGVCAPEGPGYVVPPGARQVVRRKPGLEVAKPKHPIDPQPVPKARAPIPRRPGK